MTSITINKDWPIRVANHKVLYRKVFQLDELDVIILSFMQLQNDVTTSKRLGSVLGFAIEDEADENVYYDVAEEAIFFSLLQRLIAFHLIKKEKDANGNEILSTTKWGRESRNNGIKYLFYKGSVKLYEHYSLPQGEFSNKVFDFSKHNICSEITNVNEVDPFEFTLSDQSENKFLQKAIVNLPLEIAGNKNIELQWVSDVVLSYSKELANLALTLSLTGHESSISSTINSVSSPDFDELIKLSNNSVIAEDFLLNLRYELYKRDNLLFQAHELIEYLPHIEWSDILSDKRMVWDEEMFKLLSSTEVSNNFIWSETIKYCSEEILKSYIPQYIEFWNWPKLSEKISKSFIISTITTYQWDIDIIIGRLEQKELENLLLSLHDIDIVEDWPGITDKVSFEFIEKNLNTLPFDLYKVLRLGEEKSASLVLSNLEMPWYWSYISATWSIDFFIKNVGALSPYLKIDTILSRILSKFEEFALALGDADFVEYIKENISAASFIVSRDENVILNTTTVQFLATNNLLFWGSEIIPGVEANNNFKWSFDLFYSYGYLVKNQQGYDQVSKTIEDVETINSNPTFSWNFTIISSRSDLNWNFDFVQENRSVLHFQSVISCVDNFLVFGQLEYFVNWAIEKEEVPFFVNYISNSFSYAQILEKRNVLSVNNISIDWLIALKNALPDSLDELMIAYRNQLFELPSSSSFIQQLSEKCNLNFVLENAELPWDWQFITEYRLQRELLVEEEFQIEYASYLYWPYIAKEILMPSDLAPGTKLPTLAVLISECSDPIITETWSIITKKILPNLLWKYIHDTYEVELFAWDWNYISSSRYIPIDHNFLSKYADKINWNLLSQNISLISFFQFSKLVYKDLRQWLERTLEYLYAYKDKWDFKELSGINNLTWNEIIVTEFEDKWDWHTLSLQSPLLTKLVKEKRIIEYNERQLHRFSKFIDWEAISGRYEVILTPELVKRFNNHPWSWPLLSHHPKFELDAEFLIEYNQKEWDYKALSDHKLFEINKNLVLQLQDKGWNFGAFSEAQWLDNDVLVQLSEKSWNWDAVSKNNNIVLDQNILEIFRRKKDINWPLILSNSTLHITPDTISLLFSHGILDLAAWHSLSSHPNLDFRQHPILLNRYQHKWIWKVLIKSGKININDLDTLISYKQYIDWELISILDSFNPSHEILLSFKENLNWKVLSRRIAIGQNELRLFKDRLDWEDVSQNPFLNFSVEMIDEFRDYWDYYFLPHNVALSLQLREYVMEVIKSIPGLKLYLTLKGNISTWAGYIYHFTHITNAIDIIRSKKILSRNKATSFADAAGAVVGRRHTAHEFARFYFRPQTPTQYYNECLGADIGSRNFEGALKMGLPKCPIPVFFRFNLQEVILKKKDACYMSNGNMQTNWAVVKPVVEMLPRFNFQDLYSTIFNTSDGDYKTYINYSQQEFLIKDEFDFSELNWFDIIVSNEEDKNQLLSLIGNNSKFNNKVLVDSRETNIFHRENKKIRYSYENQVLNVSTDYKGDGQVRGKIIVEFVSECDYRFIGGSIQKILNNRVEAYPEISLEINSNIPFRVLFHDDYKKDEWQIFSSINNSADPIRIADDKVSAQQWWNNLNCHWKEFLYINYLFSKLNKYARLTYLCDDSYGPHFLICQALQFEWKDHEGKSEDLNKLIVNNLSHISGEVIVDIFNLSELMLGGVENIEPLQFMRNLKILYLDNCDVKDFSPLKKSQIIHLLQYWPTNSSHLNLLQIANKEIAINQLSLQSFYEYFYGDWGSIFNTNWGREEFNVISLIDKLSNLRSSICHSYNSQVRHYKLKEHTTIVCRQFEKYFWLNIWQIDPNLFRVFLALHDIGKPLAFEKGDKSKQHKYTVKILQSIWSELPFDQRELDLVLSFSKSDCIGEYFQDKVPLNETISTLNMLAKQTELSTLAFFKIYMIYYQCDIAAYTADAGGKQFLEHLFLYEDGQKVFNKEEELLQMSSTAWNKYLLLKQSII